jgi:hypothetical protein
MTATTTCTLIADGSSDKVLMPLLERLLDVHCPGPYRLQFANDLPAGRSTLAERLTSALDLYPCNLLLVHRDAERETLEKRCEEIRNALEIIGPAAPAIYVIPVRMTEAWLLVDEAAIRQAAGNPSGRDPLNLPAINRIEGLPDPKADLFKALRVASGLSAQRLRRFNPEQLRHRVGELIDSLDVVRRIHSFQHLEQQIQAFFAPLNNAQL